MRDYRVVVTETVHHLCVARIDEVAVVEWLYESQPEGTPEAPRTPVTFADVTPEVLKEWLQSSREDPTSGLLRERFDVVPMQDFTIESVETFG